MTMIEIKDRDGKVLWTGEADNVRTALIKAVASRADLSRADLSGADLSRADLSGADLSRADLSGADLSGADLSGANLSGADLSRADLSGADLSGADLSGADLSGADLSRAEGAGDWMAAIRADVHDVLAGAPGEVATLVEAMHAGKIDGSAYEKDGCACLVGTLEKSGTVKLPHNGDRPAERWFAHIRPGDTPLTNMHAATALVWIQDWQRRQGEVSP